jgi:hypothetical protein
MFLWCSWIRASWHNSYRITNKMQQRIRIYYSMFVWSSTCLERHTAHHQEPKNCTRSLWFYIRVRLLEPHTYVKPEASSAVLGLLMMSGVSLETCWASYKHGIINSDTLLHLVGYSVWMTCLCFKPDVKWLLLYDLSCLAWLLKRGEFSVVVKHGC